MSTLLRDAMGMRTDLGRRTSRRPWRCATALTASVLLLSFAPPALGSSNGAGLARLTRTVQLTADTTSYALVSLPRAVRGPTGFPRLVQSWRGDASAVVLAPARRDVFNPANPPPALVVPNLPGRSVNEHPYVFIGLDPRHHDPAFFYHWLPPGRYRLYLITSGPAQVTLTLPGLPAGRTKVTATIQGQARTVGMHQRAPIGSLSPAFSYGATGGLTRNKGLVWVAQWMRVPARVADAFGSCLYAPPPPTPLAYEIPNCAAARTIGPPNIMREYVGVLPSPDLLTESEWYGVPHGPSGMQSYTVVAGLVQSEGVEILWLSW